MRNVANSKRNAYYVQPEIMKNKVQDNSRENAVEKSAMLEESWNPASDWQKTVYFTVLVVNVWEQRTENNKRNENKPLNAEKRQQNNSCKKTKSHMSAAHHFTTAALQFLLQAGPCEPGWQ